MHMYSLLSDVWDCNVCISLCVCVSYRWFSSMVEASHRDGDPLWVLPLSRCSFSHSLQTGLSPVLLRSRYQNLRRTNWYDLEFKFLWSRIPGLFYFVGLIGFSRHLCTQTELLAGGYAVANIMGWASYGQKVLSLSDAGTCEPKLDSPALCCRNWKQKICILGLNDPHSLLYMYTRLRSSCRPRPLFWPE